MIFFGQILDQSYQKDLTSWLTNTKQVAREGFLSYNTKGLKNHLSQKTVSFSNGFEVCRGGKGAFSFVSGSFKALFGSW